MNDKIISRHSKRSVTVLLAFSFSFFDLKCMLRSRMGGLPATANWTQTTLLVVRQAFLLQVRANQMHVQNVYDIARNSLTPKKSATYLPYIHFQPSFSFHVVFILLRLNFRT